MKVEDLSINGNSGLGILIEQPGGDGHPNMIIIQGKRGYIMCGYLNFEAAVKFGDAAVLAGGADFDAILSNVIKKASPEAEKLGVREGMTGREAFTYLA
ncbi:MAG: DUF1805 domain-containing protein [Lachnospiraceae bacterium]|jgi:uncharacterized protein YunC (DUF1805 family)|nr:DUF1805 domain-containing protein [Lachnospiraceae bacterium]MEE3460510.1 DUF1805 domain-containing protein [Lachnospiraceae bacterium]